jgi:hypothetical protein
VTRRIALGSMLAGVAAMLAIAAPAGANKSLAMSSFEFGPTPVFQSGYFAATQLTVTCNPDGLGGCASSNPFSPAISATGDFAAGSNCPATMPGDTLTGTSCDVFVGFSPTAVGLRTGVLSTGAAPGAPSATLSGTGLPPLPTGGKKKCKKKKHGSGAGTVTGPGAYSAKAKCKKKGKKG